MRTIASHPAEYSDRSNSQWAKAFVIYHHYEYICQMSLTKTPGRPSKAPERSNQVITAFLSLIGRRGLESVTLDEVAVAAGVDRTAIRHYVGNRQDLIWASVDFLIERYGVANRAALGKEPSIERWLAHLFGDEWVRGDDDAAFDVLLQEAIRDNVLRDRLRASYEGLVGSIADALGRFAPGASPKETREVAYAIICLAEHNLTMQSLGFPTEHAVAARRAALTLAKELQTTDSYK